MSGLRHASPETLYEQNDRLKADIAKLRDEITNKSNMIMNLRLRIDEQRDQLWQKDQSMAEICGRNHALNELANTIRESLSEYGNHNYSCSKLLYPCATRKCDCGFSAALEVKS